MHILVIQPQKTSHWYFDTCILNCLKAGARITFVAPEGYLDDMAGVERINIPTGMTRQTSFWKAHISALRTMRFISHVSAQSQFDHVIFLSYLNPAFVLSWPRNKKAVIFEHNTIPSRNASPLKTFFYRRISKSVLSISLLDHLRSYIKTDFARNAVFLEHPHYRTKQLSQALAEFGGSKASGPAVIFSPSGSTSIGENEKLMRLAQASNGAFHAICKGPQEKATDAYQMRPFFENYTALLKQADFVYVGGTFEYKPSGVVFEALSYGKPIIIHDNALARELKAEYPALLHIIQDIDDILKISPNPEAAADFERYYAKHGSEMVCSNLQEILGTQS